VIDQESVERAADRFKAPEGSFERLILRRDRKRRNQRIAAGVVGIAVFVAAVWIVTSGLSLDRSTPAVPGSKTGPAETAPPPARASAAPGDVVRRGPCSGPSRWRLGLWDKGDKIRVRFAIPDSHHHRWRIVLRHGRAGPNPFNYDDGRVFFSGTSESPFLSFEIVVWRSVDDREGDDGFGAWAVDEQTGEVCKGQAVI
jgi:hypothetical protein